MKKLKELIIEQEALINPDLKCLEVLNSLAIDSISQDIPDHNESDSESESVFIIQTEEAK